jgi:hypothetical protein
VGYGKPLEYIFIEELRDLAKILIVQNHLLVEHLETTTNKLHLKDEELVGKYQLILAIQELGQLRTQLASLLEEN